MSDAVLTLLRLGFLGLVWFFFLRIARSVWNVATPATVGNVGVSPRRARRRARGDTAVVVVEPLEHAGIVYPVEQHLTIGRSAACDVTLDDTFVSSQHARLSRTETGLMVTDLGSTNGTYVDRQRVTTPLPLRRGSRLQVGNTVLEVR